MSFNMRKISVAFLVWFVLSFSGLIPYRLSLIGVFSFIFSWIGLFSMSTFVLAQGIQYLSLLVPQNLKQKYDAEWGLVTGSSSGIGKAIAEKLAQQNINVVLVALDDALLSSTFSELQKKYPSVQFRKVGVNLAGKNYEYMQAIVDATEDITVSLVFNNAGYICTGLFSDTDLERLRCNMECNAGCAVPITHHFLRALLSKRKKGFFSFTSSASCYLPGPTATLYSPTKAFLTNFAATIAAENKDRNIDVLVIHPSPVNTNFYKNQGPSLLSLQTAQKAAISPMDIVDQIFAGAGRLTVWDQGLTCALFRIANKIIDSQIFFELITRFAYLNEDHWNLVKNSKWSNSNPKED